MSSFSAGSSSNGSRKRRGPPAVAETERMGAVLELIRDGQLTRTIMERLQLNQKAISRTVRRLRKRGHHIHTTRDKEGWRYILLPPEDQSVGDFIRPRSRGAATEFEDLTAAIRRIFARSDRPRRGSRCQTCKCRRQNRRAESAAVPAGDRVWKIDAAKHTAPAVRPSPPEENSFSALIAYLGRYCTVSTVMVRRAEHALCSIGLRDDVTGLMELIVDRLSDDTYALKRSATPSRRIRRLIENRRSV